MLNEQGPEVRPSEWTAYEAAVAGALGPHRALLCSGSLPPGAPPDGYARLAALARERGVTAIVDAAGPAVAAALAAAPDLVTPNLAEAEAALGHGDGAEPVDVPPDARPRAEAAAAALCARGARAAVVTAAAAGAALATAAGDTTWLPAPAVAVRNPIGAGDALLAGLAAALERGEPLAARRPRGHGGGRRLRGGRARGPARRGPRRRAAGAAAVTLLLGLDVGTTSCKAAVFDAEGEELAHGRAPTPWRRVPTGAEADPRALLAAAVEAAEAALAGAPDGAVAGVGVASMGEAGVLLDRAGEPLGPLIAWYDARGEEEAAALAADLGADAFSTRTGLPVRPMYSAVKHRWLRDHEPAAGRAVRRLNVAEWIVRGLGGDEQTEWSLASRTGWLDLAARDWWDEALAWSGAERSLLPPIALAGTPAGRAGGAIGRARGAVLAIAGHDHLSAAVGAGAVGAGEVLDSCGTAETLIRASAPLPPERVREAVARGINVGWHAVPGRHCLLGSIRSGAGLEHVMALLGVAPEERDALEAAALDAPADAGGIAVTGIGEPACAITGVGAGAAPGLVWRAALEAAGAAAAEVLATMDALAGPRSRLVVVGGWADGAAARAVKHAHLGPFDDGGSAFAGARGAALTAGRAAGVVAPL